VQLVIFIIRIYHDARSPERQIVSVDKGLRVTTSRRYVNVSRRFEQKYCLHLEGSKGSWRQSLHLPSDRRNTATHSILTSKTRIHKHSLFVPWSITKKVVLFFVLHNEYDKVWHALHNLKTMQNHDVHCKINSWLMPYRERVAVFFWQSYGTREIVVPYILESNQHPFYSFRGLKNQMRIRYAVVSWILEKW